MTAKVKDKSFRLIKFTAEGNLIPLDIGPVEEEHLWRSLVAAIGNGCELVERVPLVPMKGLPQLPEGYDVIGDESGLFRDHPKVNTLGSYLYGYPECGQIVVGDVLIIRNKYTPDGETWVGMTPGEQDSMTAWVKENFPQMVMAVEYRHTLDQLEKNKRDKE